MAEQLAVSMCMAKAKFGGQPDLTFAPHQRQDTKINHSNLMFPLYKSSYGNPSHDSFSTAGVLKSLGGDFAAEARSDKTHECAWRQADIP